LPLRPDDGTVRPGRDAHAAHGRRGDGAAARRLHRHPDPQGETRLGAAMGSGTPLFPEQASTMALRVDALYFFLLAVSIFFSLLIAGLIVFYAVKYRRRAPDSIGSESHGGMMLEITWTIIPFLISMVI